MTKAKANVIRTAIMALAIQNPAWGISLSEHTEETFGTSIKVTTAQSRTFQAMFANELMALCTLAKLNELTAMVSADTKNNTLRLTIA